MDTIVDIEPPSKKSKVDDKILINEFISNLLNSSNNLQAVLSDDVYEAPPMIETYIGHINKAKDISKTLKILNEKIPLPSLKHLKRARGKSIIVCPVSFLNANSVNSLTEYLEQNVSELIDNSSFVSVFDYFKLMKLPARAPRTKKQSNEISKTWSCNFHPDKHLEKLISDDVFSPVELRLHRMFMGVAAEICRWSLNLTNVEDLQMSHVNAAVVVTPSQEVVAVALDNRSNHPMQHSAMLAIDNVSMVQGGGAWKTVLNIKLINHLKQWMPALNLSPLLSCDISSKDYLCTNYNIYMLREPCLMCAMALVHARAKRIFFCFENSQLGAVKSVTKLQCVPSLNHHFEVYSGFV